jgi:predicted dinucleotide-binding enzyme
VVKTLNTVNALVMTDPGRVPGEHHVFVCGDDEAAKAEVRALLESFGWPAGAIVDLGDLSAARGTEAYLLLWLRLWSAFGTGDLNVRVAAAER